MMKNLIPEITRVYKYLSPEFAQLFVEKGSVRIGTLDEYRQREQAGDIRADAGEGTRTTTSAPFPVRYVNGSHVHQRLKEHGICVKGGVFTNGENAYVHEQRHPNCYLYCVSEIYSDQLKERFGGACVAISEGIRFFDLLKACLASRLPLHGVTVQESVVDRCLYDERRHPYYDQPRKHTCFLKPPRFADEAEIRALWVVNSQDIQGIVEEIPELTPHLQIV